MKSTSHRLSALEIDQRQPAGAPASKSPVTDIAIRCREALLLWLRWNDAYEHVTSVMCQPGQSQDQLESLMDEMDGLRREAIAKSQELLDQ